MSVEVTDNAERSRYEARVDGELAGFSGYRLRGADLEKRPAYADVT